MSKKNVKKPIREAEHAGKDARKNRKGSLKASLLHNIKKAILTNAKGGKNDKRGAVFWEASRNGGKTLSRTLVGGGGEAECEAVSYKLLSAIVGKPLYRVVRDRTKRPQPARNKLASGKKKQGASLKKEPSKRKTKKTKKKGLKRKRGDQERQIAKEGLPTKNRTQCGKGFKQTMCDKKKGTGEKTTRKKKRPLPMAKTKKIGINR